MDNQEIFWKKVDKCSHENLSEDYFVNIGCWTPYSTGDESHCLDCGVYIGKCAAGCCDGMSGWPFSRWETHNKSCSERRGIARALEKNSSVDRLVN